MRGGGIDDAALFTAENAVKKPRAGYQRPAGARRARRRLEGGGGVRGISYVPNRPIAGIESAQNAIK